MGIVQGSTGTAGGYRWVLSTPSAWPSTDPAVLGLTDPGADDVGDLLAGALHDWRGEGFLTFHRYQILAAMYRELVRPAENTALREYTPGAHHAARRALLECARRIGMTLGISQARAEAMLAEADDLMTRHPQIAARLRDGVISLDITRKILERTNLIIDNDPGDDDPGDGECGPTVLAEVDAAIAAELDRGAGAWSLHLVRDMADRIVFRSQPDAVRARRDAATGERRVWTANKGDDMGVIAASMTGERIRLSMASVLALAKTVCDRDPRTVPQRNSDAVFALLNQLPFDCTCDNPQTCPATITDAPGTAVVPVKTQTVVHVVADKATVDGRAANPGFMDGHGVISGDHIQDLVDDPTTVVRPLGPDDELAVFLTALNDLDSDITESGVDGEAAQQDTDTDTGSEPAPMASAPTTKPSLTPAGDAPSTNDTVRRMHAPTDDAPTEQSEAVPDSDPRSATSTETGSNSVIVLPGTQPHNPYRPSTALDTFIRIRDGYTLIPGNPHSAFHCDLDHWTEYNHTDPAAGGLTEPANLGAKDRFSHNAKTHGDWVDDLITDPDGHVRPIFITPEGIVIEGRAGPGLDLFPGLTRYQFTTPENPDKRKPAQPRTPSAPYRTRTADKHAQRHAERQRNRAARAEGTCTEPPAIRKLIAAAAQDTELGEPPY